MAQRQCPHCGTPVPVAATSCPHCRESIAEVEVQPRIPGAGSAEIRRGLMYMWVSGLVYYFATGRAMPIEFPIPFLPLLTDYAMPLLFLAGVGMVIYGVYLKFR